MRRSFSLPRPSCQTIDRVGTGCPACLQLVHRPDLSSPFTSSSRPLSSGRPVASTSHLRLNARETSSSVVRGVRGIAGDAQAAAPREEEERELSTKEEEEAEMSALLEGLVASDDARPDYATPVTPAPPPRPPPKPLSPQTLLRPIFPDGPPTELDLSNLRPKRFVVPGPNDPESVRIVYDKIWAKTAHRLNTAFNKKQLRALVGAKERGGLGLDTLDPRWRASTKGREKTKTFWKPKRVEVMEKKELAKMVMVLLWDMPDPATLSKPGPVIMDSIALSDRTLFLLLSPNSRVIQNLSRTHGVKISFERRGPVLSLVLSGRRTSVNAAKDELDTLAENSHQQEFELPKPASTLRPEVYQAVSRMSKAFLEPGETPNVLNATAIEARYLERTERLLGAAFVHDAIQSATAVYASIASDLHATKYALFPFTPPLSPPWTAGATSSFARLKTLSLAPLIAGAGPINSEHAAAIEFAAWSEKMRMEHTIRVAVVANGFSTPLLGIRAPFKEVERKGEKYAMKGTFGHVVWPLYLPVGPVGKSMEPVLEGNGPFERFTRWRATQEGLKSVFISCPPSGLLASTGVLTPSTTTPFAAILGVGSIEDEPLIGPTLLSSEFRRLVYRPVELPKVGKGIVSLEVEIGADGEVRSSKVVTSATDMMVPNGACDFQVSMTHTTVLTPDVLPFDEAQISDPPITLDFQSEPFLLDTDRSIRRTTITPQPTLIPSPTLTPEYVQVQERWQDLTIAGSRGVSVDLLLGESSTWWSEVWAKGLEAMEKGARVPFPNLAGAAQTQKVFSGRSGR